ncbi:MAG: hypothetical protein IJ465_02495 [Clostridia bacterium]|nr:hypothetical protein [Clostridia bacterium]
MTNFLNLMTLTRADFFFVKGGFAFGKTAESGGGGRQKSVIKSWKKHLT